MAARACYLGAKEPLKLFEEPILAIETSCDETSAAIVVGRKVLSNVVASQIDMHKKWGGVVPEAAARAHVEAIIPVLQEALAEASMSLDDIRAIAVTNRPGLVGALSVGLTTAKAIAYARNLPLLGVHHLEGHLCSVLGTDQEIPFPHTCLIVSGGHTEIVQVSELGNYEIVGQTIDDAAGEAFDKGARLLGLGYPGGKAIQDAALQGNPKRYSLPRGLSGQTSDFSFSGLKTAVLRLVEKEGANINVADACASLQEAVVSVLTTRAVATAVSLHSEALTLVGGVAANLALRERLSTACAKEGISFVTPPISLCTDNAAMIGLAASVRLARGERSQMDLDAFPNCDLGL